MLLTVLICAPCTLSQAIIIGSISMTWVEQSVAITYLNIANYDFKRTFNHSVEPNKAKSSNDS